MDVWYVDDVLTRASRIPELPGVAKWPTINAWYNATLAKGPMPGLLILHGGNADISRPTGDPPQLGAGGARLVTAGKRVIDAGGRFLVFSGGRLTVAVAVTEAKAAFSDYEEGKQFLFLETPVYPPRDFDWSYLSSTCVRAFSFEQIVPRGTRETLVALAILCQGYLAAYAANGRLTARSEDVKKALQGMGWRELEASPEGQPVLESLQMSDSDGQKSDAVVSRRQWWTAVMRDLKLFESAAEREWPKDTEGWEQVKALINAGEPVPLATVVAAYLKLTSGVL